jgi:hypothetical protein
MTRQYSSYALIFLLFAVGCENAADKQKDANGAQAEANREIDKANRDARDKVVAAQAEADKKVAQANADFQKMREDYRHTTTDRLVTLDRKIADLEAETKTAKPKEKADLEAKLPRIRQMRADFSTNYQAIESASATTWDGVKNGLEKQWDDLNKAVDDAD